MKLDILIKFTLLLLIISTSSCFYGYMGSKDVINKPPATNKDLLAHNKNSLEWWYYSCHLVDSAGNKYGLMFTVFKKFVPIAGHGLMVNYTVTNETTKKFYKWHGFKAIRKKRFNTPLFKIQQHSAKANWAIEQLADQSLAINVNIKNLPSFNAILVPTKQIIEQGPQGYMQYGKLGSAGYLSYTQLQAKGQLKINNQTLNVTGKAWFDKQWNCRSIVKKQVYWNWLGIQMDNNEELMVFSTINKKTNDTINKANYIKADGSMILLNHNDFVFEPKQYYTAPSGKSYAIAWQVKIPGQNLEVNVIPKFNDHELRLKLLNIKFMNYWEGKCEATIMKDNIKINGEAFLEMTSPK